MSGFSGGDNQFNGNRTVKRSGVPNVNVGGTTLQEFLEGYFFPNVAPTVVWTTSTALREKGLLQSVTLAATVTPNDGTITLRQFKQGATVLSTQATNSMSFAVSIKTTQSYDAYVEYNFQGGATQTVTASTTLTFVAPTYFGVGAAGNENEAFVEGLTKALASSRTQTRSFSPTNQRFYFAYPQSFGLLTSIKDPNNFEIFDTFTRFDLTFTLADGTTTEPYYLYRSNNNTTQTNFNLSFS